MKTLEITKQEKLETGTRVDYNILQSGEVVESGTKIVPTGFDRLLIPMLDGHPALTASL